MMKMIAEKLKMLGSVVAVFSFLVATVPIAKTDGLVTFNDLTEQATIAVNLPGAYAGHTGSFCTNGTVGESCEIEYYSPQGISLVSATIDGQTFQPPIFGHGYTFEINELGGGNSDTFYLYLNTKQNSGYGDQVYSVFTSGVYYNPFQNFPPSDVSFLPDIAETGQLQLAALLNWSDGSVDRIQFQSDVEPVPEPGTLLLLGSGLVGLAGWGKRKLLRKP